MLFFILSIIISLVSISFGAFLVLKPALAIDLQKRFYRLINWNIEPLSQEKEIRNTKIMGLLLIILTVLIVYIAAFKPELIIAIFGEKLAHTNI